jgi:hypothetical protein
MTLMSKNGGYKVSISAKVNDVNQQEEDMLE